MCIRDRPIAGYDDNMTKGLASAQPYLENMMQTLLQNMYGANMTQFIGANCIDGGDHYSIVGSMWMSSGIFGEDVYKRQVPWNPMCSMGW